MKINFENLSEHPKEELIQIVLHLKKLSEEKTNELRISIDCFRTYRTSINNSLDKIKEDLNKSAEEHLIKLTGKKR